MERIFTVAEANGLVPELSSTFERIARLRQLIAQHLVDLEAGGLEIDLREPLEAQLAGVPQARRPEFLRLLQMVKEIAASVQRLNAQGCVVKDLDVGTVDFYSVVDGEPVWLCWQYGERKVAHYHPLDEGFASRARLTGGKHPGVLYN